MRNPTTNELVDGFAAAMKEKLAKSQEKYGDSWLRKDWQDDCLYYLAEHMEKGDPVDVANYCAFMWFHGWSTNP